jgi:hypothetical protein
MLNQHFASLGNYYCNLDHGLRGNVLATWASFYACWPRDLMKEDAEDARIATVCLE